MKVLERLLLNGGIFLCGQDCLFADGMPRAFNSAFHCPLGLAFPGSSLPSGNLMERQRGLWSPHPSLHSPTPHLPAPAPPTAQVQELLTGQSLHLQLGASLPTQQRVLLEVESILGPPFGTHPHPPPPKKHRPGHTLLNCGKRELDFIQKVYKIQKADNSLTVSRKNK